MGKVPVSVWKFSFLTSSAWFEQRRPADHRCASFWEGRVIIFFSSLTWLLALTVHHTCPHEVFAGKTPQANWQRLVFEHSAVIHM